VAMVGGIAVGRAEERWSLPAVATDEPESCESHEACVEFTAYTIDPTSGRWDEGGACEPRDSLVICGIWRE
jgi:hypothetical protein